MLNEFRPIAFADKFKLNKYIYGFLIYVIP